MLACAGVGGALTASASFTINNPAGGNISAARVVAFAFRADAGNYPNSIDPPNSLTPTFQLDRMTLWRPNDDLTPFWINNTPPYPTTGPATPIYLDVYKSYSTEGGFSGYLGSSSSSVTWNQTEKNTSYSFTFDGLLLESNRKYYFAFSEDNQAGELSNFRMQINNSGDPDDDSTPGPGRGYLTGDWHQILVPATTTPWQNWAPAYAAECTPIPETSTLLSGALLFVPFGFSVIRRLRRTQ